MSNRRILKRMLSFTTAALTCTNLMFAGNCGQLFSQEGLTVFAAETENTEISIDKTYLKVGETLKINNPTGSMIRCLADGSEVDHESFVLTEEFYADIPFTAESWHGRMTACRGTLASMDAATFEKWESAHREMLKKYPGSFTVGHKVYISYYTL